MSNLKNRIDDFLLASNRMIENALANEPIKAAVGAYGFPQERLLAGRALYIEVEALHIAWRKEYGEKVQATAELNALWEEADKQYMMALKIARVALKSVPKSDIQLLLSGRRKQSLSGWLQQAKAFYTNIINNSDLKALMEQYGYPEDKLQRELDLCNQVGEKDFVQKKEAGEAQQATRFRDQKLDELSAWISDFRAVAKVALAQTPDYLEALGILARSEGSTARKKQSPGTGDTETDTDDTEV
ncbi:MAG TPA: hypothetical protein VHY08_20315 [Bacillota bacterium]|nr:hypothetical protein [Bacillota bacterium]